MEGEVRIFKDKSYKLLGNVFVNADAVFVEIPYPLALYDVSLNWVEGVPVVLAKIIELTNSWYWEVVEAGILPSTNVIVRILSETEH